MSLSPESRVGNMRWPTARHGHQLWPVGILPVVIIFDTLTEFDDYQIRKETSKPSYDFHFTRSLILNKKYKIFMGLRSVVFYYYICISVG